MPCLDRQSKGKGQSRVAQQRHRMDLSTIATARHRPAQQRLSEEMIGNGKDRRR